MMNNIIDFVTINIFKFYKLKINKFCGRNVLDYYSGIQVYRKTYKLLKDDVYVMFDFNNIIFNDSFIQYAFGKNLEYYELEELLERINFVNISIENIKKITDILTESNRYWRDSEYRKKYHENLYLKYDD